MASLAAATPQAKAGRWELGVLFVVLILFSEGILPRLLASEQSADGSPILRLMWLPVYAMTLIGCLWQAKAVAMTALRLPFMLGLAALGGMSFLWSIDPALSERRGIAIVMTVVAGLYIGTRYEWRDVLRILGLVWVVVAAASFLTGLLNPGFGVMNEIHVGAWKGLYYEKNQMGGHMARAAFLCGFLFLMDRRWRWLWGGGVFLCAVLVLLSTSKTSLLGLMLGFGILGVGAWMKRGPVTGVLTLWLGVALGGAVLAVVVFAPDLVVSALGRDLSLTGRTDIWAVLADRIAEKPVLGYGYGAFWAKESEPAYWLREVLEWDAPTAHNGWLEVAIALGLSGLVCMLADQMLAVWRALRASVDTWTGVFALGVCAQFFLFSVSESIALTQNSLVWVTYVIVAAKLANVPRQVLPVRPVKTGRPVRRLSPDVAEA